MICLLLFYLTQNFKIFFRLIKVFTDYLFHIVEVWIMQLFSFLKFLHLLIYVLIKSIIFHLGCFILSFKSLSFSSIFHKLSCIIIIVSLKLLKLSSFFKQSLWSCSTLIFKNLFFFKISSFSSLYKLISIIFISHFKMIQSIG